MIQNYSLSCHVVPKQRARITSKGNYHKSNYKEFLEEAIADLSYQFRENNYQFKQFLLELYWYLGVS